ncbi:MAG: hypothetical protein JWO38_7392 [Gemmataceae bacterium]|nr:hypothetical protein [Gemmataceae bacterium]
MSRRLLIGAALALVAAAPARAQDSPETLLSPTTQFYVKWDGIGAHKQAYQGSVWGPIMAGPTGDTVKALLAKGPKLLGSALLADPLLDGKSPDELRAVHADLKKAEKVLALIADKGVVVAAEVNEPRPTLGGLGKAVGGLLSGNGPTPDAFLPDARAFVIVPDAGDQAEVLFGGLRLFTRQTDSATEPLPAALGRTGVVFVQKDTSNPVRVAWWVEGRHFVFYLGTAPVEAAVKGMRENAAKGGLTAHPLYRRCLKTGEFESVTRGYVDTGAVVTLAKRLAGPFVPGLADKVDEIGLGNLKAVVFSSGFQGKESRALYEFDLPGERKGLARVLKPAPVTLADLPPLPPDVSRFSLLRVDLTAAYEAGLTAVDILAANNPFGVEDQGKTPAEVSRLRKEYLERELTKVAGINVREDLLPHLGDKVVIFQTPTEGLSVFGSVVCVSVKDPGKVRAAADRLNRALETIAGGPMKVRKKVLRGVELREVYGRGFGILTPTYAVVGDWLVIAAHPQPVQGLILRHKGELERWRPDAETAARLANMPADAIGIQYCNPKSTVHNLCCIGPLFVSTLGLRGGMRNETEFDPPDAGLVPNGHELGKHLFPNLTYTRDDGKTVRVEVNESLSLPLEFMGFEPIMFGIATSAFLF